MHVNGTSVIDRSGTPEEDRPAARYALPSNVGPELDAHWPVVSPTCDGKWRVHCLRCSDDALDYVRCREAVSQDWPPDVLIEPRTATPVDWPAPECPECGPWSNARWLARSDADVWRCDDCGVEFEIGDPEDAESVLSALVDDVEVSSAAGRAVS
jgi:predicted RNA-binding Zn-ribbon protein involved in translation (DUF1610 family)